MNDVCPRWSELKPNQYDMDNAVGGIITDYFIGLTCLIIWAKLLHDQYERKKNFFCFPHKLQTQGLCFWFFFLHGITFILGGIAHHFYPYWSAPTDQ